MFVDGIFKTKNVFSEIFSFNLDNVMNIIALQYSRVLLFSIFGMLKTMPLTRKKKSWSSKTKNKKKAWGVGVERECVIVFKLKEKNPVRFSIVHGGQTEHNTHFQMFKCTETYFYLILPN